MKLRELRLDGRPFGSLLACVESVPVLEREQKLDEAEQNAEKLLVLERLLRKLAHYKTSMLHEIFLHRCSSP